MLSHENDTYIEQDDTDMEKQINATLLFPTVRFIIIDVSFDSWHVNVIPFYVFQTSSSISLNASTSFDNKEDKEKEEVTSMPLLLSLTTLSNQNNSITTGSSVTPTPTPTPSSSSSTITDSASDEISSTSSGLVEDEIVEEEQIDAPPTFNSTIDPAHFNKFNRPEALTLQRVLDGVMIYFISLLIIVVFSVSLSCLWYLRNRKKTLPRTNDVELEETEDKNKKQK